MEKLHSELSTTHCHRRMICVPIDVPAKFAKYLRSAAARSNGPGEDMERSGVDFTMRTIGRRALTETVEKRTADGDDDVENTDDMEDLEDRGDNEDIEDIGGLGGNGEAVHDPHLMSGRQLRATFRDDTAEVQSALFQHSTRIAPHAKFLEKNMQIKVPLAHAMCQ